MLVLFGVLVIIASVILGMIVLIQNPKGGGLSASLGGFSNQIMGVKQTTDVLEKGTWIFAALVAVLCIVSPAFTPGTNTKSTTDDSLLKGVTAPKQSTSAPANTVPMPNTQQADTPKK